MINSRSSVFSRRDFLKLGATAPLLHWMPTRTAFAQTRTYDLVAKEAGVQLASTPFPTTRIWSFNGQSPGPTIRLRQGEPARIIVKSELTQPLTVHWHGLRIDNAMDGVPVLTQPPIQTGEEYVYEFRPPDAGTYWYHSHVNTAEQVGRGLYGPLIVEEPDPIAVDQDEILLLDDWRLDKDAQIVGDFDNPRDLARAGRLGNTVTVNGRIPEPLRVRAGERIRLRLINAANARIFALRFQGHQPVVIARDGQPLKPYKPKASIVIGPAQRLDLILDMVGEPGTRYGLLDTHYPQSPFKLFDIAYSDEPARADHDRTSVPWLPDNPIPVPDLDDPFVLPVHLGGGDLGNLKGARFGDEELDITRLYLLGKMWAMNGVAAAGYTDAPLFTVARSTTVVLEFNNHSAWPHPMHLHGHHFKVIAHTGNQALVGQWMDTVLMGPEERAKVAFVADNPGGWLFHCHILAHARAGMLAVVRVE